MVQQNPAGASNTRDEFDWKVWERGGYGWCRRGKREPFRWSGSLDECFCRTRCGGAPGNRHAGSFHGSIRKSGWQRFSSRQSTPSAAQGGQASRSFAEQRARPRDAATDPRPSRELPVSFCCSTGSNQGGWRRFSTYSQPAPRPEAGGGMLLHRVGGTILWRVWRSSLAGHPQAYRC